MTSQAKVTIAFSLVALTIFGGAFVYQELATPDPADPSERQNLTVRADSHRLSEAADKKVTVVEFLGFECETCGAAYPIIEKLRAKYDGQVTFVVRYFPNRSRKNAENAAYAVESAARQGKFEAMYKRMYDTQARWSESQKSKAALFRTYAAELGLDMTQYDADVASPEVADRIQKDIDDGTQLGVTSTPIFYLNGQRFIPSTTKDFIRTIDAALVK